MPKNIGKRKVVKKEVPVTTTVNKPVRKDFPKRTFGFYILLIFFGISLLGYLYSVILGRAAQPGIIFGIAYSATSGLILGIVSALLAITFGYGIVKRVSWTRDLAMGWYGLMAIQTFISLISYFVNKEKILQFLISVVPPDSIPAGTSTAALKTSLGISFVAGSIISILLFLFILVFFYKKKSYFVN